jgi:CBS domain containing-hemolysin-like protein
MSNFIFAVILLLLASAGVVIRKTYYYLPTRELKRQAERGDPLAVKFYRAVAYGSSLRGLLWLVIGLASAGAFIVLNQVAPTWLNLLAIILVLGLVYSWLPAGRVSRVGTRLTLLVTPAIAWLLNYLHPVLDRATIPVQKRQAKAAHTGLFERDDLVRLLDQQKGQADSRLSEEELDIAKRALGFSEQSVSNVLTPRKKVKTVSADDTVGPILIDELHKLEQPFVLVSGTTKNDIVGALSISRLGIQSTGHVRDHMSAVSYVHEKDNLATVLHAFYTTNHSLYIVVNDFEEFVGVVTVEAIIEQ